MGWVVSITPQPRFNPGERTPGTHWTGGWVGPRASLDTECRGKILCPCRRSNPDRPVVQPVVRHYTDWANPAPLLLWIPGLIPRNNFCSVLDRYSKLFALCIVLYDLTTVAQPSEVVWSWNWVRVESAQDKHPNLFSEKKSVTHDGWLGWRTTHCSYILLLSAMLWTDITGKWPATDKVE
jgi:hypothetical protein